MVKTKNYITEGPIFIRLLLFALPIMATGVLQLLYNMADTIVVGQFSGDPKAIGAVGATATITGLIVNFMVGLSGGATVVVAQFFGAKKERMVSRAVHTGFVFSLICGAVFMTVGLIVCRPILVLMKTPEDILNLSSLYLRIICFGIPALAVSNLCAAILRAVGDSKTPLIILSLSGILNVLFNLLFVIAFHMSVAGVAMATIISQYAAAIALVIALLARGNECYGLSRERMCFDTGLLKRIVFLGFPVALQNSLFSISNMLIQSATNGLSATVVGAVNGKTIAGNIDNITYIVMNSFFHAAMTFTGQNYGAGRFKRLTKVLFYALIQVTLIGIAVGALELLFADELTSLFVAADDPGRDAVLACAKEIMTVLLTTYFLCGIMEVFMGVLRGMGYSFIPMMISLIGACGLRVVWVVAIFPLPEFYSLTGLMLCYPATWIPTNIAFAIATAIAWKKMRRRQDEKGSVEPSGETAA